MPALKLECKAQLQAPEKSEKASHKLDKKLSIIYNSVNSRIFLTQCIIIHYYHFFSLLLKFSQILPVRAFHTGFYVFQYVSSFFEIWLLSLEIGI